MNTNVMSRSVILRMRNFSEKCYKKKSKHILCSVTLFFHEIMWKNIVESGRLQMAKWRMRITCWIPKAANTLAEYTVLTVFSAATMVTPTRLDVAVCVHCLPCLRCFLIVYNIRISVYAARWLEALPRTYLFQGVMLNT